MSAPVTTDSVWKEVEKRSFAVLAMVTPKEEARTAGIVYTTQDRRLYIGTARDSFKAKWIEANPSVSLTVTIPKRIPFVPFVPIPAATITFQGDASVISVDEADERAVAALFRGLELDAAEEQHCLIRIDPKGRFLTYGVGVPLLTMRTPAKARGAAAV